MRFAMAVPMRDVFLTQHSKNFEDLVLSQPQNRTVFDGISKLTRQPPFSFILGVQIFAVNLMRFAWHYAHTKVIHIQAFWDFGLQSITPHCGEARSRLL